MKNAWEGGTGGFRVLWLNGENEHVSSVKAGSLRQFPYHLTLEELFEGSTIVGVSLHKEQLITRSSRV
jgi:hypothetical protein